MDDLATADALCAGAGYADARGRRSRSELVAARNGVVEQVDREERTRVGVQALIDSSEGRESAFPVPSLHLASWGFTGGAKG